MADYKEQWISPIDSTIIGYFHTVTGRSINLEPQNPFDAKFQQWLSDGGIPDPAFDQSQIDAYQAEVDRAQDIEDAQDATGLKHVTVQQAYNYIDNTLDAASTAAEVKEAVRDIFKKVAVFLLR